MAERKPAPREAPVSIRLTAPERAWLDTVRAPGETDGAAIKRLLAEHRLCSARPDVKALREIRAAVERALGS